MLVAGDDGMWHEALPLIKTAYDVDKVVEQLEEKDSDCEDFGTCNYCQRNWCPRTLIDRDAAIKIVKAGGIDG